jgi:4'-phosphopantetheinyl transferase
VATVVHHGRVPTPSTADEITVWAATLDQARPAWVGYLDPTERRRHERFVRPADRDRLVLGSSIVRALVAPRLGLAPGDVVLDRTCPECGEPHGKIRVVGDDLAVSVSHAGDWVLVAAGGGGPLGVDVEVVDPAVDPMSLAGLTLHPAECEILTGLEPRRRVAAFFRYWTRKEAVLKTTGDGLRSPPDQLRVSGPDEPAAVLAWPARPELAERLALTDLDLAEGYVACVAAVVPPATTPAVRLRPAAPVLAGLERWAA